MKSKVKRKATSKLDAAAQNLTCFKSNIDHDNSGLRGIAGANSNFQLRTSAANYFDMLVCRDLQQYKEQLTNPN